MAVRQWLGDSPRPRLKARLNASSDAGRVELAKWAGRLDELGIAHGDIKDAAYGSGLSFRDPDGIAFELFAPPA